MAAAELLERGDLWFFYRPRVRAQPELPFEADERVEGFADVQGLHVILHGRGGGAFRRLLIGRKRMPDISTPRTPSNGAPRTRYWASIERVSESAEGVAAELRRFEYETRTRGRRVQPPARPAGRGVYALARHGAHAHLAYRLEQPRAPGEVQRALRILPQASYIAAAFNPAAPSKLGRRRGFVPELPGWAEERFGGRRFAPLDPDLLDIEGLELVLIGASDDVEAELGIDLQAADERPDLLRDLELDPRDHPVTPALDGQWR